MGEKGKHIVSPVTSSENIELWNELAKYCLNVPLGMSCLPFLHETRKGFPGLLRISTCVLLQCRTWQVVEGCCAVLWLNSGRLCHLPCSCCQASFDSWMLINPKSFFSLYCGFFLSQHLGFCMKLAYLSHISPRVENFNSVGTKCLFLPLHKAFYWPAAADQ